MDSLLEQPIFANQCRSAFAGMSNKTYAEKPGKTNESPEGRAAT